MQSKFSKNVQNKQTLFTMYLYQSGKMEILKNYAIKAIIFAVSGNDGVAGTSQNKNRAVFENKNSIMVSQAVFAECREKKGNGGAILIQSPRGNATISFCTFTLCVGIRGGAVFGDCSHFLIDACCMSVCDALNRTCAVYARVQGFNQNKVQMSNVCNCPPFSSRLQGESVELLIGKCLITTTNISNCKSSPCLGYPGASLMKKAFECVISFSTIHRIRGQTAVAVYTTEYAKIDSCNFINTDCYRSIARYSQCSSALITSSCFLDTGGFIVEVIVGNCLIVECHSNTRIDERVGYFGALLPESRFRINSLKHTIGNYCAGTPFMFIENRRNEVKWTSIVFPSAIILMALIYLIQMYNSSNRQQALWNDTNPNIYEFDTTEVEYGTDEVEFE